MSSTTLAGSIVLEPSPADGPSQAAVQAYRETVFAVGDGKGPKQPEETLLLDAWHARRVDAGPGEVQTPPRRTP